MADHKLSNTVRNASAVNLKYSADLLNLAREYVRAFGACAYDAWDGNGDEGSGDGCTAAPGRTRRRNGQRCFRP